MGHQTQSPRTRDAEAEEIELEAVEPESEPPPDSVGKGLWAMMGVQPLAPQKTTGPQNAEVLAEEDQVAAPPPAWFRGKSAPELPQEQELPKAPEERIETFQEAPPAEPKRKPRAVPQTPAQTEAPMFAIDTQASPAEEKMSTLEVKTGRSRGAMLSLLVGLFAIPLTLLAARPEIWTRIPAPVLGFGAMVVGLISFNEIQHSRGRQTGGGFAMAGMILGTIAMFLGPLVIAPWSANQSRAGGRKITQSHLEAIGTALGKYHAKHDQFPPGGTYRVEPTGETTPLHSWMTFLLPYLDAEDTYQEIHQDDPWNVPLNKPPMAKKIPAFLAAGVEQTHNKASYGLSHFAGLGGQIPGQDGQPVNVGIFDQSSNVRQSDVRDGLSQTFIAGEIPEDYRPWGEPGNWRTIGEGLNKGSGSFGNAEGSGAMFLRADGSVRFYANGIDADVLKRLSTRDGEDNRMIPEKYR